MSVLTAHDKDHDLVSDLTIYDIDTISCRTPQNIELTKDAFFGPKLYMMYPMQHRFKKTYPWEISRNTKYAIDECAWQVVDALNNPGNQVV